MKRLTALLILIASLAFVQPLSADQTVIPNYTTARDKFFYNQLYPDGGFTLYCGPAFQDRKGLNVEHVYAASWMKETAGCPVTATRVECQKMSERFNLMEADLHNLWPALAEVNRARSNHLFGIVGIDDEEPVFGSCDFEVDESAKIVEPRRIVRGNIARSIFYMHREYGAPVEPQMGALLRQWNRDDRPSSDERRRNNIIEKLQGTRNPFIDDSKLAESLIFATLPSGEIDEEGNPCLIKGNINSRGDKIYHVPGSRHYDLVRIDEDKGERFFCSTEEAEEVGWRAPL